MKNENKSERYKKLVEKSQAEYRNHPEDHKDSNLELAAPDLKIAVVDGKIEFLQNGISFCKEINLYTYWQGFGYAEETPSIKYLLVAQDWGNPFNLNSPVMQRVIRMNNGEMNVKYLDENLNNSGTDANLVELFKVLGYDDKEKPSIAIKRYPELFFTNFCLGYRTGRESGGLRKELMEKDKDFFKKLCEILEPEKILCLGRLTFECAYEALTDAKATTLTHFKDSYNKFIENHEEIIVPCGDVEAKIYPLAHCGFYGTRNRNKGKGVSLNVQIKDWERIVE